MLRLTPPVRWRTRQFTMPRCQPYRMRKPSMCRHRKHVMQLETLLRLLDNDQLNVDDTLNETRDLLEDYMDRNQVPSPVRARCQGVGLQWVTRRCKIVITTEGVAWPLPRMLRLISRQMSAYLSRSCVYFQMQVALLSTLAGRTLVHHPVLLSTS